MRLVDRDRGREQARLDPRFGMSDETVGSFCSVKLAIDGSLIGVAGKCAARVSGPWCRRITNDVWSRGMELVETCQ